MSFGIPVRNGLGLGLLASTSLSTVNGAPFSPLSLFASGEPGGWWEPSDISTLSQDSAGTIPVTAVEQPVGRMADKSQGLVLGPELVSNPGPFTATTGWTGANSATVSTVDGKLRVTSGGGNASPRAYTTITTVVGRTYEIAFSASIVSGSISAIYNTKSDNTAWDSNAVYGVRYFIATATTTYVAVQASATVATAVFDVTSFSVKDLAGNHLTQSTSTARPVLSARVNLLTQTEAFNEAVWLITPLGSPDATITANAAIAPDGTTTADAFIPVSGAGQAPFLFYNPAIPLASGVSYSQTIYIKPLGTIFRYVVLYFQTASFPDNGRTVWVDMQTLATQVQTGIVATAVSAANSFIKITMTATADATTNVAANSFGFGIVDGMGTFGTVTGNGTDGLYIWGADLRVANDGVGIPAYQRVGVGTPGSSTGAGSSDYTVTGFPLYLRFDGTDDFMVSAATVNFSATAQMSVFAGLRKQSDAAPGAIIEQGIPGTSTNNFWINSSAAVAGSGFPSTANYEFSLRGNVDYAGYGATTFTAPVTNVISVMYDLAASGVANEIKPRVNATIPTLTVFTARPDAGPGNFDNLLLYIGRRTGTVNPFNGRLYSLIVRGAASTADQITQTETWVNSKTGAY